MTNAAFPFAAAIAAQGWRDSVLAQDFSTHGGTLTSPAVGEVLTIEAVTPEPVLAAGPVHRSTAYPPEQVLPHLLQRSRVVYVLLLRGRLHRVRPAGQTAETLSQ